MRTLLLALFCASALALTAASCASAPSARRMADPPAEPVTWVELGAKGKAVARVITGAAECPHLNLTGDDGSALPDLETSPRALPTDSFGVRTCEAELPAHLKSARLGDQYLPVPSASTPSRILFIGDTGCRIHLKKDGKPEAQGCNDPKAWPFPALARVEAALEPELIVHLGDVIYREAPCPPENALCAGSPSGYGWESWNADFFDPAAPLLRKAPWIFVRGNHELCSRAGEGWFRFLDPGPERDCVDLTEAYPVTVGDAAFAVLDSALAADPKADEHQVELYKEQFKAIAAMKLRHAWLVSHRPLWAPALTEPGKQPAFTYNQTLQAASGNRLPPWVDMLFAGHLHLFEDLQFADGRPPVIVAGNGGTALSPAAYSSPVGMSVAGARITGGQVLNDFGFFLLERRTSGEWAGTAYDNEGHARLSCEGPGRKFHCEARAP